MSDRRMYQQFNYRFAVPYHSISVQASPKYLSGQCASGFTSRQSEG